MAYSVELNPRAELILLKTIDFYNERRKGQGNKFYAEVIRYFSVISKKPDAFQFRYNDVRVAPMKKHPHLIFYKTTGKTVHVLSVLHSSQDTDKWPVEVPPIR